MKSLTLIFLLSLSTNVCLAESTATLKNGKSFSCSDTQSMICGDESCTCHNNGQSTLIVSGENPTKKAQKQDHSTIIESVQSSLRTCINLKMISFFNKNECDFSSNLTSTLGSVQRACNLEAYTQVSSKLGHKNIADLPVVLKAALASSDEELQEQLTHEYKDVCANNGVILYKDKRLKIHLSEVKNTVIIE